MKKGKGFYARRSNENPLHACIIYMTILSSCKAGPNKKGRDRCDPAATL